MLINLRQIHIFIFFIILHLIFWNFSEQGASTLIKGDWEHLWNDILNNQISIGIKPYASIFSVIEELFGLGFISGVIFFSSINTFLFFTVKKIIDVFSTQYSEIVAFLFILSPTSLLFLATMYKDNLAYLAFSLMLLLVARALAMRPCSVLKSILLYLACIFIIYISRGGLYYLFVSFILSFATFFILFSTKLNFDKLKIQSSFFLITFFHLVVFHGGIFSNSSLDLMKSFELNIEQDSIVTGIHVKNQIENLKIEQESKVAGILEENQNENLKIEQESKVAGIFEENQNENLKIEPISPNKSPSLIESFSQKNQDVQLKSDSQKELLIKKNNLNGQNHKTEEESLFSKYLTSFFARFMESSRERKSLNIFAAPNAALNYDSENTILKSDINLLISHASIAIFAPGLSNIFNINAKPIIKAILFLETLLNYCLVFCLLFYLKELNIKSIIFIGVLFGCMYIMSISDSNFGTYLRHAYIFHQLFICMGFLAMIRLIEPNIKIKFTSGKIR